MRTASGVRLLGLVATPGGRFGGLLGGRGLLLDLAQLILELDQLRVQLVDLAANCLVVLERGLRGAAVRGQDVSCHVECCAGVLDALFGLRMACAGALDGDLVVRVSLRCARRPNRRGFPIVASVLRRGVASGGVVRARALPASCGRHRRKQRPESRIRRRA